MAIPVETPEYQSARQYPQRRLSAPGMDYPPSFISRSVSRVKQTIRGAYFGWMTPGEPIAPVAPYEQPRRRDYPQGYNYSYTPRAYEQISFWQLRALANNYDLMRLIIETRKDQISRLPNRFRVIEQPGEPPEVHAKRNQQDKRIPLLEAFFKRPDREHTFRSWQRAVVDQMLTIDATTILPRWTLDGHLYGFDVLDGATISPTIDAQGRTPVPPDVAYRQIIHGVPMLDLMAMAPEIVSDQIMYCPRNYRPERVYGYSPVEQTLMTINIAIRRQLHQLEFYTEGSIPDAIIETPEGWSPDQIREFEMYWNSILTGQTGERRRAKFLEAGSKVNWTKDWLLKDEMDDYIIRVMCYAFGVSPIALVKMVNRAAGSQISDDSKMEGLEPVQLWFSQDIMNPIIQDYIGFKDIEHTFMDAVRSKPLEQAQINAIYYDRGVLLGSEIRADLGRDPLTQEQIDNEPKPAPDPDIQADTGAGGTKDRAGQQAGGGAPTPRSAPRSTEKDKGNSPKGTDAGKVHSNGSNSSNGHSHTDYVI